MQATVWDLYFCGLMSMLVHPGTRYAENSKLKNHTDAELIQYAAELANQMMQERSEQCSE